MTGDVTSVPLRPTDRWTAALLQQGRVLLDTDWNLAVGGPARDARQLARDAIGPAGVPVGSTAFKVEFVGGALTVRAGTMWIGGLLARNPADLAYAAQPEIAALPASGLVNVYLDAFVEEVQAAEDPSLLDPALAGVDTTTRTRVGWRVRAAATTSATCSVAGLPAPVSTGRLDVARTAAPVPADPCAPPDDPRSKLPDGLLRIEVLDAGSEKTARFAWSYANGSEAVAAKVAGTAVTLAPSPAVTFAPGDLVEVSTLARRADRRNHGALFTVAAVAPSAGGDTVTLGTASPLAGDPPGTCLRRWDGQVVGAAGAVPLTLGGADVGIAFTARPGAYQVGDWWGVRVRGSAADAVETLTNAPPDGVVHTAAPLAVVDLTNKAVLTDCRPTFPPLTGLRGGTCTVTAFPGDDLQAALDALPATGGELCLAAGTYRVTAPLTVKDKQRVVVTGVGPATVLVGEKHEAVLIATRCPEIEVTRLRVESDLPTGSPPGDAHLLGALSFLGCRWVRVRDCQVWCPDSSGRAQSGIYAAPDAEGRRPSMVEVRDNLLLIGDQQIGILVASALDSLIVDNIVALAEPRAPRTVTRAVARELGRYVAGHLTANPTAGDRAVRLADERTVRMDGPAALRRLAAEWAKGTSARRLRSSASAQRALARFVATSVTEPHQAAVGKLSARFLAAAVSDLGAVGQGIVVAGDHGDRVRVEGNQVLRAVQGVHVALRAANGVRRVLGKVVITNNTVTSEVPFFWARQRHAFYVGSFTSLTMLDNRAELRRMGDEGTPVDAVRVIGQFGAFLQLRGLDASGPFRAGVLLRDEGSAQRVSLRYVSDVLNPLGVGVRVELGSFTLDRCIP
ncbi:MULTISPECIES: DUF6519 domain-containing protein [Micromonospora]|uniref:Uncharacterized protein n=1 Tax=Micromonospora solifontis TaxID=2487138 RepID=A0ABX9WK48_9ACTN|nr:MULTISPECIES: DUF6519 domain-containing protein [Micromonospora]NES13783.1 hypothetical protein [Micromonospora sp. PPF5-17B]NES35574.1 hypothetical protein [Micromonospora solifontis]NES55940.1 hypothetical protein [Micromonospora sp. PPF5-6]RNM00626.1 hypothetical protein EFE23_05280 [Micromonospora solifontis]